MDRTVPPETPEGKAAGGVADAVGRAPMPTSNDKDNSKGIPVSKDNHRVRDTAGRTAVMEVPAGRTARSSADLAPAP